MKKSGIVNSLTKTANSLTKTANKVGFGLKKNSPEVLVVLGVVGTVASMVMMCKATTKASEITDEMKEDMDKINTVAATTDLETYSEEDHKKDTTIVYAQTAVKFVKLYGPSVVLAGASLFCIVKSHDILRKRNVALAAAYTAVDKGFKEYRGRVVERFGKDIDRELRYNIKAKEIEETVVNEKGKEKTVKKTIDVVDPNEYSIYAKFFDESCRGWDKDPENNKEFLLMQQSHANDRLRLRGYLFLNDVYEMLGIPKTIAGQAVGWVYDEKNPVGDNFVDFGIFDIHSPKARDFVNGYERTILLDFNADGDILHGQNLFGAH